MCWQKRFLAVLIILVLPMIHQSSESQAGDIRFNKFVWASSELNNVFYPKVAILVPVKIAGTGKKLFAQLDTGCNGTFFYGKLLEKRGVKFDSDKPSSIKFSWIDESETPDVLKDSAFISWSSFEEASIDLSSEKPEDRIVGTIGLDKIVGKILVLDFPQNGYALFSDSSELPAYLKDRLEYVPAVIDNARFFVNIVIGNDTLKDVFYDTGASISTLVLPLADWQRATGLKGDEPEITKDSVMSWGKYVKVLRAPSKNDLNFGSINIKTPIIEYVEWPDTAFAGYRLMGNAPFYNDYIIVVDCKYSRMGVAKSTENR